VSVFEAKVSGEVPSAAACAEAAAWIARLHGEGRSTGVEAGFKRWLAACPEHHLAFEMANEIWLSTEHLPKPETPAFVRWPKGGFVVTWPRALAAMAVIALVVIGITLHARDPGLITGVGEQRNLTLEDGSRVSLNTASRIHVTYDSRARRVELDEGEAYFEVARHPNWPFIVVAGGKQVVALGTAFLVRRDEDNLAVTLVEGRVTVAPAQGADITLAPGQRLTFSPHEPPRLDRPPLDRVIAWQRGQVARWRSKRAFSDSSSAPST